MSQLADILFAITSHVATPGGRESHEKDGHVRNAETTQGDN